MNACIEAAPKKAIKLQRGDSGRNRDAARYFRPFIAIFFFADTVIMLCTHSS